MSRGFDKFFEEIKEKHPWAEILEFEATENLIIECWSTKDSWENGVPVLKSMSPNRVKPHDFTIMKGTKFEIISTQGLSSGCPLIYWRICSIWFQAMNYDAEILIKNSFVKGNHEQKPRLIRNS